MGEKGISSWTLFSRVSEAVPRGDINRLRFMVGRLSLPPDAYAAATSPVRSPRPNALKPSYWVGLTGIQFRGVFGAATPGFTGLYRSWLLSASELRAVGAHFLYAGISGKTGGCNSPSSSSSDGLTGRPPGLTNRAVTKMTRLRLMC